MRGEAMLQACPGRPAPILRMSPQHVVQRGNNRMPCFLDNDDRRRYLTCLRESLLRFGCQLHTYVLMTIHVHLLVSPQAAGNVSRLMQNLGRAYVQTFNARHRRTGTLWEGRYKSCLVGSGEYVLRCHRYIELNPVRACMVDDPARYRWSSHPGNAGLACDPLLTRHPAYNGLGLDSSERTAAYLALFKERLSDENLAEIRAYLQQQRALGSSTFQRRVERELQRYAAVRPAHRPRKLPASIELVATESE